MKLVLASGSPGRKEILSEAGVDFEIRLPKFDERKIDEKDPRKLVRILALGKAESVKRDDNEVILSGDTIVSFNEEIIGKPEDKDDAFRILKLFSGNTHLVITGYCLIFSGKKIVKTVETKVTFRDLGDGEIRDYVENFDVLGKAGAYAVQHEGFDFIEKVEGSMSNVIGLPIEDLFQTLEEEGLVL